MRVLITGSHGFVGSNLIEAFAEKYEIIRWDVRSDEPLPKVDGVIHLAGKAHDTRHTSEAAEYFEVNKEMTRRLYDRFLESSAKNFIFFSSIKAQDGDTPYALSKKAAEEIIIQNEKLRVKNGQSTYILRPCMIHGPGNKGNLNLLCQVVKKGFPWPLAAFENKRSFATIGNVAYIVSELLEKEIESGTFNICDDDPVSTNELIEIICQCLEKNARLWRIPQGLMNGLAKVGDVMHLPFNTESLGKLTDNYIVDNSKIKLALGIDQLPIRALEGLKSTIKYMINNQ